MAAVSVSHDSIMQNFDASAYELKEKIGEGGFGSVYRAKHTNTGQIVAIKFLSLSADFPEDKKRRYIARFERETMIGSRLQHPNIVRLLDKGCCKNNLLYAVFEYVDGQTLKQLLADKGTLPATETAEIMSQVLDALAHAHEQGVIHRDIKPANIMLVQSGVKTHVKVLDFGIGTLVDEARQMDYNSITLSQETLGTPSYSAPEQLRGEPPTIRTDIYVWGLVFIECLIGRPAVYGGNLASVFHKQLSQSNVPLPAAIAAHPVSSLLRRALHKKTHERTVTAEELFAELKQMNFSNLVGDLTGEFGAQKEKQAEELDGDFTQVNENIQQITTLTERKQLTAMAVCLQIRKVSDEDQDAEVIDALHHDQLNQCVDTAIRYGAFHVATLGDTMLFYFGYPAASDNDTRLCARAALDMVSDMGKRNSLLRHSQRIHTDIRIGIHTGVVTSYADATPEGDTPNTALELMRLASTDQVLCSDNTRKTLETYIEFDSDQVRVVGVNNHQMPTWSMTGERQVEAFGFLRGTRSGHTLIGRDRELSELIHTVNSKDPSIARLAYVYGEAGIGKSRLVFELRDNSRHFQHFVAQCLPEHQNNALYPVLNLIKYKYSLNSLSIDAAAAFLEKKVTDLCHKESNSLVDGLPVLFAWLNLPLTQNMEPCTQSPEAQRKLLFGILTLLLLDRDDQKDCYLYVFEDLHWADPTSIDFVGQFAFAIKRSNDAFIATSRQDIPDSLDESNFHSILVDKLTSEATQQFITALFTNERVADRVIDLLEKRTDGIPLFVEELVDMLQQKKLVDKLNGIYDFINPDRLDEVPETLRDSLQQKLDSLVYAKETAQLAATIGREFDYNLLVSASNKAEAQIQSDLKELIDTDLILQQRKVEGDIYLFKHALVRDSAYDSLSRNNAKKCHKSIALAFKSVKPDLTGIASIIAEHFYKSEDYCSSVEYGIKHCIFLSDKSLNEETKCYIDKVLGWVDRIDGTVFKFEKEKEIISLMLPVVMALDGYGSEDVKAYNDRFNELVEKTDTEKNEDELSYHTSQWHKAQIHHMLNERTEALSIASELVESARKENCHRRLVDSLPLLGLCLMTDGHLIDSLTPYQEAIEIYNDDKDTSIGNVNGTDPKCHSLINMALALALLGRFDEAEANIKTSIEWAESIKHGFSIALSLCYEMYVLFIKNDRNAVIQRSAFHNDFFNENEEFSFLYSYSRAISDWACYNVDFQEEFSKSRLESGQTFLHSLYQCVLALTYFDNNEDRLAQSILTETINWCESSGEGAFVNYISSKINDLY